MDYKAADIGAVHLQQSEPDRACGCGGRAAYGRDSWMVFRARTRCSVLHAVRRAGSSKAPRTDGPRISSAPLRAAQHPGTSHAWTDDFLIDLFADFGP